MLYSYFNTIILDLYSSFIAHSFKNFFFFYISSVLEFSDIFVILDIVFNFKRNFVNISSYLYFMSPIFYYEFLFNKFVNNNDINGICRLLDKDYYQKDQIYLIINKYFKDSIYNQNCYYANFLKIIIIIILFSTLLIHLINLKNSVLKFMKYFFTLLMYFLLKTTILVSLVVFNKRIIIQMSDYYENINKDFIYHLVFSILFFIIYIFFMNLLIFAYFENSYTYLHNQYFYIQEVIIQELSCMIFILRLNSQKIIIIKFIWVLNLLNYFILKIRDMVLFNDNSKKFKFFQITFLLLISFFLERIIILLFINWKNDEKIFKILELCVVLILYVILVYFFYEKKISIQLYVINDNFKIKNSLFFYGMSQIFQPIHQFFDIKFRQGKISGKEREFINLYINYFKNHLFKNEKDFNVIGNLKEKLIPLFLGKNIKKISKSSSITMVEEDNEQIIYKILLFFLKHFKKNIDGDISNEFNRKVLENLIFYKIHLFFIIDDKTFRAQYYLQNFLHSKIIVECPYVAKCILKSIRNFLLSLEKKSEDNSMIYIIILQELNNQYFQILRNFKEILKNLSESKFNLFKLIDQKSSYIKNSLEKIIEINKHADDEYKLRNQSEFDKFQLIEEIIFNENTGKNYDFFDSNSLDSVVDKNDSFLILFESNELIIKKAPFPFYEYTKKKTNKLQDKKFDIIFPHQIAHTQIKIIKKHLLKDRHYTIITVIEDINGYIVGCKLHFSILPTFQGLIYITCKIDTLQDYEIDNYALFTKDNYAIKFGILFKDYFGFNNENSFIPLLHLFGIKNYSFDNFEIEKEKEYNINLNKVYRTIKKNFEKYNSNYETDLTKLKKILKENKTFNLQIIKKNKFKEGNQDYYLLQFNIIDIIKMKKQKKKATLEKEEPGNLYAPSIRDTASVASAISTRMHKENVWNISTQAKKIEKSENNIFSTISFGYSIFLIGFAIFICIYTKIYSNKFKKDYTNISIFRKNNIDFVWGQYSLSNMITKKTNGDPFEDLFINLSKEIPNFQMDFFNFYLEIFQNSSTSFFNYQSEFKKQFGKIPKSHKLYRVLYQTFKSYNKENGEQTLTYFNSFDVIFTNYYTIAKGINEVMRFPNINFQQIPQYIENITEPNKTCLEILYNYPSYFEMIERVIFQGKEYFNSSFKNFKFIIYLFFILFLAVNLFGIIIILLSINLSTKILNRITKSILSITHNQLKSLKKKLKYGKLLILNERKASTIIDELKRAYAYNKAKKKKQLEATFIDSNPDKILEEDNNDYIPVVNLNQKDKKYYYHIFIISIENLFFSLLLYGILMVVAFPIMKKHFKKISTQIHLSEYIDDLNIFLVHYLIKSKISILFNSTDGMDELIKNKSVKIYKNYSAFATIVEKKEDYSSLISKAGNKGACEFILSHIQNSIYYDSVIKICKHDSFFEARYSVKLSGFLSKIRNIFLAFKNDRIRSDFNVVYYAGYPLQSANLFEYIFYMTFLGNFEDDYIKPDLENMINGLTNFILIIFIIMIIFQIFNYIQGSYIILDRFVQTIEVYNVIGKFFETKEKNEKNKK